jgi:hypothetical protein
MKGNKKELKKGRKKEITIGITKGRTTEINKETNNPRTHEHAAIVMLIRSCISFVRPL